MKLSTRMRYGTRALVDLAFVYPKRVVSIKEMAEHQGLSVKYLEHIMLLLKTSGMVKVARGKNGGYCLAKDPTSARLIDVYHALEGPITLVDCTDAPETCPLSDECVTRDVWAEMERAIESVLMATSLEDLVKRKKEKCRTSQLKRSEVSSN